MTKTRFSEESIKAIELCKKTREDYIIRMKQMEGEHIKLIDETRALIAKSK